MRRAVDETRATVIAEYFDRHPTVLRVDCQVIASVARLVDDCHREVLSARAVSVVGGQLAFLFVWECWPIIARR